mgnify:CR=1 FL=1
MDLHPTTFWIMYALTVGVVLFVTVGAIACLVQ